MQSKRGGLVPIGKTLGKRPGPVQARHHFTQGDQVNLLVNASEADPDLGSIARLLALCKPAPQQPRQPERVQARQQPLQVDLESDG